MEWTGKLINIRDKTQVYRINILYGAKAIDKGYWRRRKKPPTYLTLNFCKNTIRIKRNRISKLSIRSHEYQGKLYACVQVFDDKPFYQMKEKTYASTMTIKKRCIVVLIYCRKFTWIYYKNYCHFNRNAS